ncbi:MAG: hypothetical protein ACRD1V_04410 [Vicinamibacterales bacterium]
MPLGFIRCNPDSGARCVDPGLETGLPLWLGRMLPEPVPCAGEFPRGVEVLGIAHKPIRPNPLGRTRAGEIVAICVQRVGIGRLRSADRTLNERRTLNDRQTPNKR